MERTIFTVPRADPIISQSRRKYVPSSLPTLYFRDSILSAPGYVFEKAIPWEDTGSLTLLAEGSSLKDGSNVIAKIAPAHTNASVCLQREAHILARMQTSPEALSTTLRLMDFISISRSNGDCVVLLLVHPGPNLLGRYLPLSRINALLLAEPPALRLTTSQEDIFMSEVGDCSAPRDVESTDTMDLATFLEFAIQATHCLENLHRLGIVHREVRANAYHINAHSGVVRLVHYGNRSVSLEMFGGPSSLVIQADGLGEENKSKVKEALCYLSPEQTGSMETTSDDHRTDMYSLGIMFWTLLVGRGMLPFEGGPLEILHSIAQKRPMPVHEVRRDVPQVVDQIYHQLLSKNPDSRYQSAYGLKADLLECQKRLSIAVSSSSEVSSELIPPFEIAKQDRYAGFTSPNILFGREKELETIRNVIRHASTSYLRHNVMRGVTYSTPVGSQMTMSSEDSRRSSSRSSRSSSSVKHSANNDEHRQKKLGESSSSVAATSSVNTVSDGIRKITLSPARGRGPRAHGVVVIGPAGQYTRVGKSSLILANQAKWRAYGLWGHAKFQSTTSAPFAALLSCLSSVLRQLMVFHTDLHRFVAAFKAQLGPQLRIVPLLYEGVPELRDILNLFDVSLDIPQEALTTRELRARFQSLVENVFSVLAETRLFALFLDDLHEADESSLDLVNTLASSRSRILIFITLREDKPEIVGRVRSMFSGLSRATWIQLDPLTYSSVASLVSRTLRQVKDNVAPLSRLIHGISAGNAFSVRNLLATLQRQHQITFDWDRNCWQYDLPEIEKVLLSQKLVADPNDISYLTSHLRKLPVDARKYLVWASCFGATFRTTDVAMVMDHDSPSGSSSSDFDTEDDRSSRESIHTFREKPTSTTRRSMRGLQIAIAEGWLVQRARDMCSFAHDRYRQAAEAEALSLPDDLIVKMSFRIISMMLVEPSPDVYQIAERAQWCLPLLREHDKREELVSLLTEAGESAWARGAHEMAYQSLVNAQSLLDQDVWTTNPVRTFSLYTKLAELSTWRGDYRGSDKYIEACYERASYSEERAFLLRLRSQNKWMRNDFGAALEDTLQALHILGVDLDSAPTLEKADDMFEQVKSEILAVGFDAIIAIPRTSDSRTDLAVALLGDAGTHAYWSTGEGFTDVIGLTTIQLALRSGMSPGTALGFFWALGAAAERKELYRFSVDLGKLALRIAERYGTNADRCRSLVMYCSMVSAYDNVHIRSNLPRLEEAIKYANSAGDRVYASLANFYSVQTRLFICQPLDELVGAAEETHNDMQQWPQGELAICAQGLLNCIRALGGYTLKTSAGTIYTTDTFNEDQYLRTIPDSGGSTLIGLTSWVVALFNLGYVQEAAELGFSIYDTRDRHPNHRHTRYALFFHNLAMIACVREEYVTGDQRKRYLDQVMVNQVYIRRWLSASPVNTRTWVALVDAELSSLEDSRDAFRLYDVAVTSATNYDWPLEEGWALYLQGSHFVRCGVHSLGSELQRRGISRQRQWGARGIVLVCLILGLYAQLLSFAKRNTVTMDIGVQTDSVMVGINGHKTIHDDAGTDITEEEAVTSLPASALASVLKWSKDIAADIHLFSALQRLTEIATETSGAQSACIVITGTGGEYRVATSMISPGPCKIHEHPISVRAISDPLQRAVILHSLNTKERIAYDDISSDSRFSSEARQSPYQSVVCLPIFSNRGQTFGALYLASKYAFSQNTITLLTLLCQQANISVANALLFRSVQAGTKENLRMISAQKEALEYARQSREDALKATRIKSNFLASMSHELRTPFSSFYGLLDILSGTELNNGQREIVQTAKQSCELLLKIIDSILDYSKLEASALKLDFTGFPVEDIIADCMELLLPMAAKKLDLSFNIDRDVPAWVQADYTRIRQVLMNLIGNAVKFTPHGAVKVLCSLDNEELSAKPGDVNLKFVIEDTGIGLSPGDVDLLFVPFQQADNSSTRRFGGTGLGLSICRQLVKLMGGVIGVRSELGKGSIFWFIIPVKIFTSEESEKAMLAIQRVRARLMEPRPPRVLISSPSDAATSLLSSMLDGFDISAVFSVEELEGSLRAVETSDTPLDCIILDNQAEATADGIARLLESHHSPMLKHTKLIHLYTPVTDAISSHPVFGNSTSGVIRMTKPPRKARLLQALARLRKLPPDTYADLRSLATSTVEEPPESQRTLFGNVLIAEDNPVAQKLLVKQLQRYDLNVIATSNGEEAIAEWERHEPGYFSLAMFDHHMPICDGVEAAKRLRLLENRRKVSEFLPVIALSADCQESTKMLCLSAGMNSFLSKPLKKSDLALLLTTYGTPIPPGTQTSR
ncbi:histidine kinase [Multifurca ochricompacta]|uniref:histidine kinase n=1 Tax=Multifurca ochricompacta TaxID=376703 RepID=A0AAD4MC98_9AGAM|nr:histidine kinase [Multifurca ochricompacta]